MDVAYQAPQSIEFSRQEYRSGLPFPSPQDVPNPEIEPGSPALRADALLSEPPGKSERVNRLKIFAGKHAITRRMKICSGVAKMG